MEKTLFGKERRDQHAERGDEKKIGKTTLQIFAKVLMIQVIFIHLKHFNWNYVTSVNNVPYMNH